MYTITILRSSPKSQTSFKDMLDPKRSKFGPKRAKMGRAKFFRTVNLNFPKEDHMNSFNTKNHPYSMNHLEDISQNVDFRSKGGKFGPKRVQNGRDKIFPGL